MPQNTAIKNWENKKNSKNKQYLQNIKKGQKWYQLGKGETVKRKRLSGLKDKNLNSYNGQKGQV